MRLYKYHTFLRSVCICAPRSHVKYCTVYIISNLNRLPLSPFPLGGPRQHSSAAVTVNLPTAEQYSPLNVVMSASCGTRV